MTTAARPTARRRATGWGAVLVALTVLVATPAAAEEVTSAEAAERARAAVDGDVAPLDELRAVTAIDGRPVDLGPVLSTDGDERAERLGELAELWSAGGSGGSTEGDAAASAAADRTLAADVLDQDRFKEADLPRPFRRPLQWLGDRVKGLWDGAVDLLAPVLGTRGAALLLVAAMLAGLVAALAAIIRRRSKGSVERARGGGNWLVDPDLDPADLEAAADRASAAGDHGAAVRLRYEAGLLRLVDADRLVLRPETTAGSAARQVGDPTMDELTVAFEEIVYGERAATAADDDASRTGWRTLLASRSRR